MRITLTVTAGPHQGQVFTFAGHDTFIVGRAKRAHFRLPAKDKYFSRVHFLVEVNPPHCRLLDLGSRNGTFVNGQKVASADLRHGDLIKGGQTLLRVEVVSEPASEDAGESSHLTPPRGDDCKPPTATALEIVFPVEEAPPTAVPPRVPAAPPVHPPARVPEPRKPVAAPPSPSRSVTEPCRLCGALVTTVTRPCPSDTATGSPLPVCPSCEKGVRQHPQPIPGYKIAREVGRGGMGVIWLALHLAKGNRVALKTVVPAEVGNRGSMQRFLREASILRDLNHPHIVAFHDVGEADGQLFFAMEYVVGVDAGQLLKRTGALPVGRAVALVCQLLDALEYAHAKGFVHRDIKPANVLITEEGGREVVKLADFGLARVYQSSKMSGLTMTREGGGTPAFMAPEQITDFREAKPAADQYATAATLYNLLTARHIYDLPPSALELLRMMLQEDPVPIQARRADLPGGLADAIHRALAREPEERFPNVRAMREALQRFGP